MTRFRAYVADDYDDPLNAKARLIVVDDIPGLKPNAYLGSDGGWHRIEFEGERVDDAGILLPRESLPAIAEAIARWGGSLSDGATEAKVLREWIAVESKRVDEVLRRG